MRTKLLLMLLAATAFWAPAQTAVTTSGMTSAGTVAVFGPDSTSTVTNSPITISGGNVGIGTSNPNPTFDLTASGNGIFTSNSINNAGVYVTGQLGPWGTIQAVNSTNTGLTNLVLQQYGGYVGIGTSAALGPLDVYQSVPGGLGGYIVLDNNASSSGDQTGIIFSDGNGGPLSKFMRAQILSTVESAPNYFGNLTFLTGIGSSLTEKMRISGGGNVGIGTTSPAQRLEVNGSIQVDSGGIYFPGSTTPQTTPWTGVLCGGDYSEAMNAKGSKKLYEPGDVLVLASDGNGSVMKSQERYSTLVAGIYATKPGVIGRRANLLKDADEVPMAMIGVVPAKVTAENGPVHLGDLLVTSSTPGYAMKGTDRTRLVGAVIGKAMGSLSSGTGIIDVLVTLQ